MKNRGVILDCNLIDKLTWNKGYGNLIQHLLFAINLSKKHHRNLLIPSKSILDEIFDLPSPIELDKNEDVCCFIEKSAFYSNNFFFRKIERFRNEIFRTLKSDLILKNAWKKSKEQYEIEHKLINNTTIAHRIIKIEGHFWHYELMPSIETLNEFSSVKIELINFLQKKYPGLSSQNSISIHYRATDFGRHLNEIFHQGIALNDDYYKRAIELAAEKLDIKEIHLFADDKEKAEKIFSNYSLILHDDSPAFDWVGLFLSKNIIQSNSTFCWTASLYNKEFSIQPKGGYNCNSNKTEICIPFGFYMSNSVII
ncbi:MAG: hypothetical protein JW870_07075 [Candidatus Delongbacteria bacterium]|nr:hypothetical protein [Candidatus Delongbacteria bacterium]